MLTLFFYLRVNSPPANTSLTGLSKPTITVSYRALFSDGFDKTAAELLQHLNQTLSSNSYVLQNSTTFFGLVKDNDFTLRGKEWSKKSADIFTVWKLSKYVLFSNSYFPIFGLSTGKYGPKKTPQVYDQKRKLFRTNSFVLAHSSAQKFYIEQLTVKSSIQGPEKTPYLDTFHTVFRIFRSIVL